MDRLSEYNIQNEEALVELIQKLGGKTEKFYEYEGPAWYDIPNDVLTPGWTVRDVPDGPVVDRKDLQRVPASPSTLKADSVLFSMSPKFKDPQVQSVTSKTRHRRASAEEPSSSKTEILPEKLSFAVRSPGAPLEDGEVEEEVGDPSMRKRLSQVHVSQLGDTKVLKMALSRMRRRSRPILRPSGHLQLRRHSTVDLSIRPPSVATHQHLRVLIRLIERDIRNKISPYLLQIRHFFASTSNVETGLLRSSKLTEFLKSLNILSDGELERVAKRLQKRQASSLAEFVLDSNAQQQPRSPRSPGWMRQEEKSREEALAELKEDMKRQKLLDESGEEGFKGGVDAVFDTTAAGKPEKLRFQDGTSNEPAERILKEISAVTVVDEDPEISFEEFKSLYENRAEDEMFAPEREKASQSSMLNPSNVRRRLLAGKHLGTSPYYLEKVVNMCKDSNKEFFSLAAMVRHIRTAAAESIQVLVRRFLGFRRRMWIKVSKLREDTQYRWLVTMFRRVAYHAQLCVENRADCRRPFVLWRRNSKIQKRRQGVFRVCFWPLYVWRKWALTKSAARRKSRFLKRIWTTLLLLRNFRAWKFHIHTRLGVMKRVVGLMSNYGIRRQREIFAAWREWSRKRQQILRIWRERGLQMRKYHKSMRLSVYFVAWRYYCAGRGLIRDRAADYYLPSLELVIYPFPRLADFAWGGAASSKLAGKGRRKRIDVSVIFELTFERLERIDRNERLVLRGQFKRLAPRVMNAFKANCLKKRKKRYAVWIGSLRLSNRVFRGWRRQTLKQRRSRFDGEDSSSGGEEDEAMQGMTAEEKRRYKRKIRREKREERDRDNVVKWANDARERKVGLEKNVQAQRHLERAMRILHARWAHRKRRTQTFDSSLLKVKELRNEFLEDSKKTDELAKSLAEKAAEDVRKNRAVVMHDTLFRVFEEMEQKREKEVVRICWAQLKLLVMARHSGKALKRERLRRWCKLAVRLRVLNQAMPMYYRLKVKWRTWNNWLHYIHRKLTQETPGLANELNQRRERILQVSTYLRDRVEEGRIDAQFGMGRDGEYNLSPKCLFSRWVQFTQTRVCRARIAALLRQRHGHRLRQKAFFALRTSRRATADEVPPPCFGLRRCEADIDRVRALLVDSNAAQWRCKVMRPLWFSEFNWLWRRNRWIGKKLAVRTKAQPTLKKYLQELRASVERRCKLERKLLFDAFDGRGIWNYQDSEDLSQQCGAQKGGSRFSQCGLAGKQTKIGQIIIHVDDHRVLGLAVLLRKHNGAMIRTRHIGNSGGRRHVYSLSQGDDLIAVEGNANRMLSRIRFRTNRATSRWYGVSEYGSRFKISVAESSSIVGFFGRQSRSGVLGLGPVVRAKLASSVFANCWQDSIPAEDGTPPEPSAILDAQQQFATILRMRTCDVQRTLDRTQKLARLLYSSASPLANGLKADSAFPDEPGVAGLSSSLTVTCGVATWFFEGLARSLVKEVSVDQQSAGETCLRRGRSLLERARKLRGEAQEVLEPVQEFRAGAAEEGENEFPCAYDAYQMVRERPRGGDALQNLRLLGAEIVHTIRDAASQAQRLRANAVMLQQKGRELIEKGHSLTPSLPADTHVRLYYEGLRDLAATLASLGPDHVRLLVSKKTSSLERRKAAESQCMGGGASASDGVVADEESRQEQQLQTKMSKHQAGTVGTNLGIALTRHQSFNL